ncbi:PHB depolymerase family esterase [soil metagenome]
MFDSTNIFSTTSDLVWEGWNRNASSWAGLFAPFVIPVSPSGARSGTGSRPAPKARTRAKQSPMRVAQADSHTQFIDGAYTNDFGTREYKLFIPHGVPVSNLPLIVMLHGCQQTAEDFAAGTHMNEIAQKNQCMVLYPSQASGSNCQNCWNWFNKADQRRDSGEPSLIAGMTREIIESYRADATRVYIAGMSAGGAMAASMAALYPDLFAAVGVHSGLPFGAANDIQTAISAMSSGVRNLSDSDRPNEVQAVPLIVFHGDEDTTVHPGNAEQVIAWHLPELHIDNDGRLPHATAVERGSVETGHAYTRTIHTTPLGLPIAEKWMVHGAGHAWSGGSKPGSFTDPRGPDAGAEMMRFFSQHSLDRVEADNIATLRTLEAVDPQRAN